MIKWIVIIILTLLSMTGFAQPQAPAPDDFPGGDPGVPIGGISSLLIAGGIIFGGKKAYDLKKKNEEK